VFFIIISALHISGGFSANHQELIKQYVQPWVLSCFPAVYAGVDGLELSGMQVGKFFPSCIPDSHLHRVTYTRCYIDTIVSPDDEHRVAQNM
jgi:hypothetical protein